MSDPGAPVENPVCGACPVARDGGTEAARVRPAAQHEIPAIAELFARAFARDPLQRWLVPRPSFRRDRRWFRWVLRAAEPRSRITTPDGVTAAAVWRPPGPPGPRGGEPVRAALGLAWLFGHRLRGVAELAGRIETYHPEGPHWHLALLGVEPEHQGRGLGSTLLAPVLAHCDAAGLPIHLECSRETHVPFYRCHGFRVVGRIQIPGGPALWPMRRAPGAAPRPAAG